MESIIASRKLIVKVSVCFRKKLNLPFYQIVRRASTFAHSLSLLMDFKKIDKNVCSGNQKKYPVGDVFNVKTTQLLCSDE